MFFTVYQITNKSNGKIYIGKHQTKDLNDDYMGSGKRLRSAIEKYGIENFTKEILFQFDNEADMNSKEAELVTEEFCLREDTYNLCPGGKGGWGYINNNDEIVSKRDTYENKLLGRIAANKTIEQKYGSLSELARVAGSKGNKVYSEKYKNDKVFRDEMINKLKLANEKSQSEESRLKRKQTMASNNHGKGSKNSQFGKRWIFSIEEKRSIAIAKTEPLPDGWFEGRKIKFD
jgi:hypothetical protein